MKRRYAGISLDIACLAIIGGAFLLGTAGCAFGNNARVSLGATAVVGYNSGSMGTPGDGNSTSNSVQRAGGGSLDASIPVSAIQ